MADEYTGTGNFGAAKEDDVDTAEERDLVEEPLTDEEQGNQDINKPSADEIDNDLPDQSVEEGRGGIDDPRGEETEPSEGAQEPATPDEG